MARVTIEADDYSALAELLDQSGSPLTLPELHGGLCGVMCAGGQAGASRWLSEMLEDCRGDAVVLSKLAGRLEQLGDATWKGLCSLSFEFTPLLPAEESDLEQRAEALGLWCHGFIAGLVIGGLDLSGTQVDLSDELSELIRDFGQISRAGAEASVAEDDEGEEDEVSLAELVEYVRVGAQYIFEELAGSSMAAGSHTIH